MTLAFNTVIFSLSFVAIISGICLCVIPVFFDYKNYRITTFLGFVMIGVAFILNLGMYRELVYNYEELNYNYTLLTTPVDNEFYYIGAEIDNQAVAGYTDFITENGNIYRTETNPEWDWDSIYLLTMDNNATPEDYSDDIICVVWKEVNSNVEIEAVG